MEDWLLKEDTKYLKLKTKNFQINPAMNFNQTVDRNLVYLLPYKTFAIENES